MSLQNKLMAVGQPSAMAQQTAGDVYASAVATGTTQADALPLSCAYNYVATVDSGTGVRLYGQSARPSSIGDEQTVYNAGANALNVYPPAGEQIVGAIANAAFSIPTSSKLTFKKVTNTLWVASETFVQSGTAPLYGWASRTAQAKASDYLSVKDVLCSDGQAVQGDGSHDDTTGIQAALNTYRPVYFPPGRYVITDTLTIPTLSGSTVHYTGEICGAGAPGDSSITSGTNKFGTVIVTSGSFAKPAFKFVSSRQLRLRNFTLIGPAKGTAGAIAFHLDTFNSDTVFDNLLITGFESAFQNGESGGAAGQGNDEIVRFYDIKVSSCTYVVRSYNSQAYIWNFFGCAADTTCDTFLKTESSGGFTGNKVQLFGGDVACTGTIFSLSGASGTLLCHGVHIEPGLTTGTNALVDCGSGSNSAAIAVSFVDCLMNFAGVDYTSSNFFIRTSGAGPFRLAGCQIAHPNAIIHIQASNLGTGGLGNGSALKLADNNWSHEPTLIRPDTGNGAQYSVDNNIYKSYNKNATQGVDTTKHSGWISRRICQANGNPITDYYSDTLPTGGTYLIGDRIYKFTVVAAGSPGWVCTANGTYGGATDNTGDTDGSTAVITGVADTSDFVVGGYVTVSAGFAGLATPKKIIALTASTMTLDANSNSAQVNITVTAVDPVWKTMAVVSA